METQVVAARDSALDAYGQPFHVQTVGQAVRSFTDAINNPDQKNDMSNHPDDFELYHLASYNNSTGTFTNLPDGPKLLARGKDLTVER